MTAAMLWLKAVHVIAIISWMAGLLYLFRLYVYHAMETEPVVKERLKVMERRLLNAITTPAAVVATVTGISMLVLAPYYLEQPYMWIKLTLVAGMLVVHILGIRYRKVFLTAQAVPSHRFFRVMNEIPTLLMIGIVIMIIVRPWARA
jgi:protoporphyrinogen IX oxidase